MDRRTFLVGTAATGALLVGCSALGSDADDQLDDAGPSENPEPQVGDARTSDADPAFRSRVGTVVDFETAPLTASVPEWTLRTDDGLTVTVELVGPATAESPATLVATVTNERPFEQTLRSRRLVVLDDPPIGRTDDDSLAYLAPIDPGQVGERTIGGVESVPDVVERTPTFERDADGRWRLAGDLGGWFAEPITLGAGESVAVPLALLAPGGPDPSPIRSGRYRFEWRDDRITVAVWRTDEPGPTDSSRFDGLDAPALRPDLGETAWFHEASRETPTFLRPSTERIEPPGAISFDFVTRSRESATGNPHYWRLYKLVDDEWLPIEPWVWTMPAGGVPPGGVDESTLTCFHGEPVEYGDDRPLGGFRHRTVGHLGGGRYAYTVGYRVESETHAAVFDLAAPPLEVEPDAGVRVEDEGERILVEDPNHADARRPATLAVTRADDATERLIDEQLPRRPFRAHRNALPFFEPGVRSVVVRADRETALRPVEYEDGGATTFEYDGGAFEAVGAELDV